MTAAFDIGLTLVADEVNLLPVGVDGTRFYTENGELLSAATSSWCFGN
jgi:hypothetical protein